MCHKLKVDIIASGSKGNCYQIDDGETILLIEAGLPVNRIQVELGFSLFRIAGVLISHEHQDHAKAVKRLIQYGVDAYMSAGTASALGLSGHRVHAVRTGETFVVGSYTVLPFATKHDAREPFGYFIRSNAAQESLLFFTDTYYLEYLFEGVNYIIGECNYSKVLLKANRENGTITKDLYERIYRSHMSLETLKDFLRTLDQSALRQIYLVHLSDSNADAALFKREIQRLTGAEVIVT